MEVLLIILLYDRYSHDAHQKTIPQGSLPVRRAAGNHTELPAKNNAINVSVLQYVLCTITAQNPNLRYHSLHPNVVLQQWRTR